MNTRSATWTPPRPLPTMAPAMTNSPMPTGVPGRLRAATPISRPAAQLASTQSSVRRGPNRSTRRPQPKLASDGDHGEEHAHHQVLLLGQAHRPDGDHAHDDDDRVDRVGVEEPSQQEAAEAGHRSGVVDGPADLAERRPGVRPGERPARRSRRSRTYEEDRDREDGEERHRDREVGRDR